MQLTGFLQLLAACTGILGSLFFAIGVLRQSVKQMADACVDCYDWNPHMVTAVASMKADYLFGGALILAAFTLQLTSFLVPPSAAVGGVGFGQWAPTAAAAVTAALFFLLRFCARKLALRYEALIKSHLKVAGK